MIAVLSLDGYSASSRKTKMHDLVFKWMHDLREMIGQERIEKLGLKSTIFRAKKRRIRRWIMDRCGRGNILICVGKSYGGANLLRSILPHPVMYPMLMKYDAVGLLTVDINFPIWRDLTPNLNHFHFNLPSAVDIGYNIYVKGKTPRQQCGAIIDGAINIPIKGYDHFTVVHSPLIPMKFELMLVELLKIRR